MILALVLYGLAILAAIVALAVVKAILQGLRALVHLFGGRSS